LLVHVPDPVVADVDIQLKGLKQGHHRRAMIIARPGGGVGGDHQALAGCLAQGSKPGVSVARPSASSSTQMIFISDS
jgi:hypothetical protein